MDVDNLELKWVRYRLPLREPLRLAHGTLTHREGILVRGREGWLGDAAPLPGFSKESLDEVEEHLRSGGGVESDFPSLRFACSSTHRVASGEDVRVNALWIPESETLPAFLSRTAEWKSLCVKVKLRVEGFDSQVSRIADLCAVRPDAELRVDPNRSLSVEQALHVYSELAPSYIEEPFMEPEEYERLWQREAVPVGLDESLLNDSARELLIESPQVKALVLKPTLLGAPSDYAWAFESAKPLVFSSCFESGVGTWAVAGIARHWGSGTPAGLDTNHWLAEDVVRGRPSPVNGLLTGAEWTLKCESLRLFD